MLIIYDWQFPLSCVIYSSFIYMIPSLECIINFVLFMFYDLLLYLLWLILLWYNIGLGEIVSFYMNIRLVRQHGS